MRSWCDIRRSGWHHCLHSLLSFLPSGLLSVLLLGTVAQVKQSRILRSSSCPQESSLGSSLLSERTQRRGVSRKSRSEEKRKQDELDEECRSLASLHVNAKETFLSLMELVPSANKHLDKAEHEFSEGAFAPFWDEVESATNQLAAYHQDVHRVENCATEYTRRSSVLNVRVPSFEMPLGELPDARPVAARLSQIVRRAQKDFQFATIYEQRKTNQLLYAGFGTLASAIDRMQTSIVEALEDLSVSLNTTLDSLVTVSQAQADMMASSLDEARSQSAMLDNIQRRRKPS